MKRKLALAVDRLLKAGKCPKEILELHPGYTSSGISYRRERLGIPKFRAGRKMGSVSARNRKISPEMIFLKKQGWTYDEIGKRYGFSRARAHQIISGINRY